jgi:hypothetical protein
MVGIGYMTFPKLCALSGLVNVLAIILITVFASLFGSYMILRAYAARPSDSYPLLVLTVLGVRHYSIMTVVLALYVTFSITMYIFFGWIIRDDIADGGREEIRAQLDFDP